MMVAIRFKRRSTTLMNHCGGSVGVWCRVVWCVGAAFNTMKCVQNVGHWVWRGAAWCGVEPVVLYGVVWCGCMWCSTWCLRCGSNLVVDVVVLSVPEFLTSHHTLFHL